eukprot:278524-Hanusia_phi.AAC.2
MSLTCSPCSLLLLLLGWFERLVKVMSKIPRATELKMRTGNQDRCSNRTCSPYLLCTGSAPCSILKILVKQLRNELGFSWYPLCSLSISSRHVKSWRKISWRSMKIFSKYPRGSLSLSIHSSWYDSYLDMRGPSLMFLRSGAMRCNEIKIQSKIEFNTFPQTVGYLIFPKAIGLGSE